MPSGCWQPSGYSLFFSGCFYTIGRCCIKRRPRNNWNGVKDVPGEGGNNYAEQMRLDAVKAEADRKARQKQGEVGLPAFQEYDPSQPLHAKSRRGLWRRGRRRPLPRQQYSQTTQPSICQKRRIHWWLRARHTRQPCH